MIPEPVVSCRISTYQHLPYIRQCIEGILMQKTNFPFEIVIGEDESSDGTREICIEYAEKYPDKIRLFLHKRENNIIINGRPTPKFQGTYTMSKCRGKYHAICEGDDYWIDPYKLQKQVDLMEQNETCSMVFTGCIIKHINSKKQNRIIKYAPNLVIDAETYVRGQYFIATASTIYRREIIEMENKDWMLKSFAGDFIFRYKALILGNIHYIDSNSCVYNKGVVTSWSNRKLTKKIILKEYSDNMRALYYLIKNKSITKEAINSKLKMLRLDVHSKIALSKNVYSGLIYLLCLVRRIPLVFVLAYMYNEFLIKRRFI